MYTRILVRAACAALAIASALPDIASASMAMQGQRLRAPKFPNPDIAAASAVVSGDWIAVFGRLMPGEGGGMIMLYHRGKSGVWNYMQTLYPPDANSCLDSMVMTDNKLFVACPFALDADRGLNMGVVTAYTLSRGEWNWTQTISSATGFYGNPGFGTSLAAAGDRLFVGYPGYAPMPDTPTTGDVEVLDISTSQVTYQMQVLPDASIAYSNFGSSVAATDGLLAVGADGESVAGAGSAGVAYTFELADGDWFERSVLTAVQPQPYDNFPSALAFQQSHLVAGSATNGAMNADGSLGAAFAYGGQGASLALDDVLMPSETQTDTLFGQSLAMVGNTVFVGEPSGGVGGHVHIYNATATGWAHASAFAPAETKIGDAFGFALASDGHTLVITSPDSPATRMGAVYVMDSPPIDQIFGDGSEP